MALGYGYKNRHILMDGGEHCWGGCQAGIVIFLET